MRNDKEESVESLAEDIASNIIRKGGIGEFLRSYQLSLNHFISSTPPIDILPSRTVPLTDTSLILAHNAYNSLSSGSIMPNQALNLTELLDIGVRGIELDVHWDNGDARLCHEICNKIPILSYNRLLSDALNEINNWLMKNPSEVLIIKFEDYLGSAPVSTLENIVRSTLNTTSIFTPADLGAVGRNWPSIDNISGMGKQIILMPQNTMSSALMFHSDWGGKFKNSFSTGTIAKVRPSYAIPRRYPTELFEVGEDKTFLGRIGSYSRGIIPVGGEMTKEDIQSLRTNGVTIISLDHIESKDSRLTGALR
ncbi:hypothetical protein MIDIC_170022 [Alphaproteobacteria bacterium]